MIRNFLSVQTSASCFVLHDSYFAAFKLRMNLFINALKGVLIPKYRRAKVRKQICIELAKLASENKHSTAIGIRFIA